MAGAPPEPPATLFLIIGPAAPDPLAGGRPAPPPRPRPCPALPHQPGPPRPNQFAHQFDKKKYLRGRSGFSGKKGYPCDYSKIDRVSGVSGALVWSGWGFRRVAGRRMVMPARAASSGRAGSGRVLAGVRVCGWWRASRSRVRLMAWRVGFGSGAVRAPRGGGGGVGGGGGGRWGGGRGGAGVGGGGPGLGGGGAPLAGRRGPPRAW